MNLRSSRRVTGLKPNDYDHEINLVDNDGLPSPPHERHTLRDNQDDWHPQNHTPQIEQTNTNARLLSSSHNSTQNSSRNQIDFESQSSRRGSHVPNVHGSDQQGVDNSQDNSTMGRSASRPSIEIQGMLVSFILPR
jgi:hypothetical protein